jgi:EmrB/QacA subfamily drug resistance transporter
MTPEHTRSEQRWTLLLVCVACFMLLLDITVVNVALPSIDHDLNASFTDLQWVIDAYALTLASFVLVSGSLADRLGRRRIFVISLGIFTLASLLCALAGSPLVLNLSRALQGVGGAGMFAVSLALIATAYEGPARNHALGIYGATIGAAVAIGPLVGGALTDAFGWQAVFLVNVPIGLVAMWLVPRKVVDSRDPDATRIDWVGCVLFSASLFLLVNALLRGNDAGWGSAQIVGELAGSVVGLLLFVVFELRRPDPMFDLRLFRVSSFGGAQVAAFAISSAMFSLFLYITLYLQNVLGYTPLESGMRTLPITLVSFVAAPAAGRLLNRVGPRVLMGLGLTLVGIGLLLMAGVHKGDDWTTLLAGFVVAGAGIGLTNPSTASVAVGVVPRRRSGMASGINNTFRQVGIATGIAVWGALFLGHGGAVAKDDLAGTPGALGARSHQLIEAYSTGNLGEALRNVPAQAHERIQAAAQDGFLAGLNLILHGGAIVAFAGALLTVVLVRPRDFAGAPAPEAEPVQAAA